MCITLPHLGLCRFCKLDRCQLASIRSAVDVVSIDDNNNIHKRLSGFPSYFEWNWIQCSLKPIPSCKKRTLNKDWSGTITTFTLAMAEICCMSRKELCCTEELLTWPCLLKDGYNMILSVLLEAWALQKNTLKANNVRIRIVTVTLEHCMISIHVERKEGRSRAVNVASSLSFSPPLLLDIMWRWTMTSFGM